MREITDTIYKKGIELLSEGLAHSAVSFSSFTNQKIDIQTSSINFDTNFPDKIISGYQKGEKIDLLVTDIIGELQGKSYLIFSEEEKNAIFKFCTGNDLDNSVKKQEFSNAILLEIDNVVSAAVITKLSNYLKKKIYGGVPKQINTTKEQLAQTINYDLAQLKNDFVCLTSETKFIFGNDSSLKPQFVWILPNTFLDAINEVL